jgi:septal ring-binding cell division protein DamX
VVATKPPAPVVAFKPAAAVVAVRPAPPVAAPRSMMLASAPKPAVAAAPAKGKFTLHLSTFGTPETANAFAEKYPGAFVVAGDVPGKGLAYRVRYGNFASFKEATAAKESFEKEHNAIALVAAR